MSRTNRELQVSGSERSWDRILLSANVPGNESFPGHFTPGSESSREKIGQGPIGRFAPGIELAREGKGCESLLQ